MLFSLVIAVAYATDFVADTAGADADQAPCVARFGRTWPEDGATDVPLNAGLAIEVTDGNCAGGDYSLGLYAEGEPAPLQEVVADVGVGILELLPATALEPNTSYTLLALESTGYVEPVEATFTTGESVATVAAWEPAIDPIAASWVAARERVALTFRVGIPLGQPDYTWVRAGQLDDVADTELDVVEAQFGFGGGTVPFSWSIYAAEMPAQMCIGVQGRSIDGSWGESVAQCVEVIEVVEDENTDGDLDEPACGCSAGSTGPALGAGLAALFGVFARRRRA